MPRKQTLGIALMLVCLPGRAVVQIGCPGLVTLADYPTKDDDRPIDTRGVAYTEALRPEFERQQKKMLEAIAADLDNEFLRLKYADFLQDWGLGERAEAIRLEIAIARRSTPELKFRLSVLWTHNEKEWRPTVPAGGTHSLETRKGVFEVLYANAGWLAQDFYGKESICPAKCTYFDALMMQAPTINNLTVVRFNQNPARDFEVLDRILQSPHFHRIREFRTSVSSQEPKELSVLFATAALKHLRKLSLECATTDEALVFRYIADSPHLGNLTELRLTSSHEGLPGVLAILSSPRLKLSKLFIGRRGGASAEWDRQWEAVENIARRRGVEISYQ